MKQEIKNPIILAVILIVLFFILLISVFVLMPWAEQIACISEIQACKYFHAEPRECIIRTRCL